MTIVPPSPRHNPRMISILLSGLGTGVAALELELEVELELELELSLELELELVGAAEGANRRMALLPFSAT